MTYIVRDLQYNVRDYRYGVEREMNNSLYVSLEELRGRMVNTALLRKTLQDRDVLRLSQQLDTLIVQALTEQHRLRCHGKPASEED
jgi:hypothetical protein